jgi:hypothetical protein
MLRFCLLLTVWSSIQAVGYADDSTNVTTMLDVAGPARITGTVYEIGSQHKKILFHFERTATRTGSTVQVQRRFTAPGGSLAAVESVLYVSNCLVAYHMKEFQANLTGTVEIEPDLARPGQKQIVVGYGKGPLPEQGDLQTLKPDTLVDDNLYPFMLAHWDDLMRDEAVKFRFVSIEWRRTFNFQLVKIGEAVVDGNACELISMKPTGFMLEKMVNPLIFTVEKAAPHMMLSYIGRTTPRVKKDDSWKYLDAETVFDLEALVPQK